VNSIDISDRYDSLDEILGLFGATNYQDRKGFGEVDKFTKSPIYLSDPNDHIYRFFAHF
jgi:hypothetical protein